MFHVLKIAKNKDFFKKNKKIGFFCKYLSPATINYHKFLSP